MDALSREIARFHLGASRDRARSAAIISLQLICGEDLDIAINGSEAQRRHVAKKLLRLLERERLRGLRGHWSYDLNRHIGLRQALNLLSGHSEPTTDKEKQKRPPEGSL